MNIGFEAKRAFTNNTGLGHYSRTLIDALANYYPQNEYFLCTPKRGHLYHPKAVNQHTITPTGFWANMFSAAWRSSWIKKDLKRLKLDIYHGLSHEIPLGMASNSIKTVVTMHDLIFERYPEQYHPIDVKIYRSKFTHACKNADKIIAISLQTKADLIEYYKIPEQKIAVCYQSCNDAFMQPVTDTQKQTIRQRYGLPETYYLYVGSIIERKNLLTLCKALLQVPNNIPLVIIGGGTSYKKKVQAFIEANHLQEKVIFLSDTAAAKREPGFKSAADFPAIYQQAIALIYPSIFEGFGIPILEALCSGTPVITSNISCMPETGGNAALYVDPFNDTTMAAAMEQLATNTDLRTDLIEKGYLHAQNFTRPVTAQKVMELYQSL
jgi:glycosyltransferase involved in cell wall biosynthesis